jgi:hypothetical protein
LSSDITARAPASTDNCCCNTPRASPERTGTAEPQRILEDFINGVGEKSATMWAADQRSVPGDDGVEMPVDVGEDHTVVAETQAS